jgi:hypothetical protein
MNTRRFLTFFQWCYIQDTIIYSFYSSTRLEHTVVFWNTKTNDVIDDKHNTIDTNEYTHTHVHIDHCDIFRLIINMFEIF